MSWQSSEDNSGLGNESQADQRRQSARPSGVPSFFRYLGVSVIGGAVVSATAALSTAFPNFPTPAVALGTTAALAIGQGFTDYVKKRFETHAEAETDAYDSAPRITAAGAGSLEQAHAVIAGVLKAVREIDAVGKEVYDNLKASVDRLAAEMGGGSTVPEELSRTYGINMTARTSVERAHRALDGAAASLARFNTQTLRV